jgi:hypothetical protein
MKFNWGLCKGGIIKSCQDHELYLREKLAAGESPQQLYQWHLQKLAWLQHERLIHLLVTIATGLLLLFTVGIGLLYPLVPGSMALSTNFFLFAGRLSLALLSAGKPGLALV